MSSRQFPKDAHGLLRRQLKRHAVDFAALDQSLKALLEAVDGAYKDFDDDRQMIERSLDLSSRELLQANRDLRALLSDRKKAEKQMELLHAQRLEATGLLAGGVAHDFNNLLAIIKGSCDALMQSARHDDPRHEMLAQIDSAAKHAASLTRQLLAFSRRQVLQPKLISLNETIGNLERIVRPLVGEGIELRTKLDPKIARISADPAQIEQVVLNLVVNARDAMPAGGKLWLETARASDSEAASIGAEPGAYVRLTVKDSGTGMSPEVKARIFEPFFTTKTPGKGTGLGLSTVYGIVRQSGGVITVDSELGMGTSFNVLLPASDSERQRRSRSGSAPSRESRTLLLVEDASPFRALLRGMLGDLGYRVLEAATPSEAEAVFGRNEKGIELLVTDVVMPEMSGRELAERLRDWRPELKVLFISGFSDERLGQDGVLEPGIALLEKPFTSAELARKLNEVFGS